MEIKIRNDLNIIETAIQTGQKHDPEDLRIRIHRIRKHIDDLERKYRECLKQN